MPQLRQTVLQFGLNLQAVPPATDLATHLPDPVQVPATSTELHRLTLTLVLQVTLGLLKQVPPMHCPVGQSLELAVQGAKSLFE